MNDESKPGTAVQSQTQAVNFWKAQPDLNHFKTAMSASINEIEKVIELKGKLKKLKTKARKFHAVTNDSQQNEVTELKKDIVSICKELLKETERGKKLLKAIHQYSCDIEKELVGEYTGKGGIVEKIDKMVKIYATAEAVAQQKKNDEAIARAADETSEKKKNLISRADTWEEKKPEKAAQLREEAEGVEVMPEITPEDPKNWTFEATVLKKRVFLQELINDPNSDLTGIIIQKSLLNAIARARMCERPREHMSTTWGYIKGTKKS